MADNALTQYIKDRGAKPLNPEILADYIREMEEVVIPQIEKDAREQAILQADPQFRFKPLF